MKKLLLLLAGVTFSQNMIAQTNLHTWLLENPITFHTESDRRDYLNFLLKDLQQNKIIALGEARLTALTSSLEKRR